ncbi:translational GTPase TypA, partial [Candidatus Parcubacteria bacterium]|nr:translational GTPase TypA [Candidatus Parcubacteria bacterium]
TFQGLNRIEVESAVAGDIVQIAGIPDVYVGDTIAQDPKAEALPVIAIDPPTLKMDIMVNNSPLAGREGTLITSRQIRDRLKKECETNVGLLVDGLDSGDVFTICGRGEMHISILLEQMRREGFELQVGQPQVILKEENGQKLEPIMQVIVDVPDAYAGIVIEKLGARKGEMHNIQSQNGSTRLEYLIPTRGLLGYKSEFITDTRGEGTLSFQFDHYGPFTGEIDTRKTGSIISGFDGITSAYSLDTIQARGPLFIGPGTQVYEGMVIGKSMKETIEVNPIKGKKLTNMRASGADMSIKLTPPLDMTLEKALEYIGPDELVEITPESIRIRKKFLKAFERKRHG